MATSHANRKLRAILSADVKGYSLLMADDELATVTTLKSHKETMTAVIQEYNGRVVDSPGDNLLAEFASAVDAVKSAVKIQEELTAKNAELSEERHMQFRIGINIGDVIHEGDRIYGDGVNVAARIESLADPGGVAISRNVCNQVKQKLELGFQHIGEHTVKNIAEPVSVYRVLMHPGSAGKVIGEKQFLGKMSQRVSIAVVLIFALVTGGLVSYYIYLHQTGRIEPASVDKMAFPLPDKPSIAVLPFDNMSDDPEQEYFSDGITEEIITSLSKMDQLFVIARNSTFTYKGKPVKVKQVAEELGVRYVLEGSVRKSEKRVRITAQLIDAVAGNHLWAERYDSDLLYIFDVQDEISRKIVNELHIKLTDGEQARIWGKKFQSLDVYLKFMEAMSLYRKGTRESIVRFGQLGRELVDLAPENFPGYRVLGWYYFWLARSGQSTKESIAKAFTMAQKAVSLDESEPTSHGLLGQIYLLMRQYEKAIATGERAVALSPNGALVHMLFGMTLSYVEREDEAIDYLKKGIRLNPFPSYYYFVVLGNCYFQKKQYEKALAEYKKALHLSPEVRLIHLSLACNYVLLNRQKEAEAAAKKVMELDPNFSVARASKAWPYENQAQLKQVVDALQKAGLQ